MERIPSGRIQKHSTFQWHLSWALDRETTGLEFYLFFLGFLER